MVQALIDLIEHHALAFETAIRMLSQLLKAELAEREVRSIGYHMQSARFQAMVRPLHRREFMDGTQNLLLIGGPGTGKNPCRNSARHPGH